MNNAKGKLKQATSVKSRRVIATWARQVTSQMPASASHTTTPATGWRQAGVASWYGGSKWQGHTTASGVRYNENALTAAHATLPIGTRVRVTIIGTERSVIVTITDLPGTRSRVIDLSRAAAQRLGILARGIASVTLTRVEA